MKEQKRQQPVAERQPYEPPKATFVPLKLEERLMTCDKTLSTYICSPAQVS